MGVKLRDGTGDFTLAFVEFPSRAVLAAFMWCHGQRVGRKQLAVYAATDAQKAAYAGPAFLAGTLADDCVAPSVLPASILDVVAAYQSDVRCPFQLWRRRWRADGTGGEAQGWIDDGTADAAAADRDGGRASARSSCSSVSSRGSGCSAAPALRRFPRDLLRPVAPRPPSPTASVATTDASVPEDGDA